MTIFPSSVPNFGFSWLAFSVRTPIGIVDDDLSLERAELRFLLAGLFCPHNIDHRRASAANGHRLAAFHRLDQLWKLVFCIRHADFHGVFMIAITDSHVKRG